MALPKNLYSADYGKFDFGNKIKSSPERGAQFSVLYADGKGWKSTIASYAKNPIILPVWLETGHRVVDCPKFPEIGEYEGLCPIAHVFAAINWLMKEQHSRKTLIIDNLTSYREAVVSTTPRTLLRSNYRPPLSFANSAFFSCEPSLRTRLQIHASARPHTLSVMRSSSSSVSAMDSLV